MTTNKTYKVEDEIFNSYDEAVNYCYEQEIIYYYNAMEYLSENDASLNEGLELASELGYELKDLNSEILATLLYQQELIDSIKEN